LIAEIERRMDALLAAGYNGFHHNCSERGDSNIKVKVRISGQFRVDADADRFAKIRSIVDTAIKNGRNVFALCPLWLIAKTE
jgi:transposase